MYIFTTYFLSLQAHRRRPKTSSGGARHRTTPDGRTLVTEPHVGCSDSESATVVALDINDANGVVIDAVEKFRPPSYQDEKYDVFVVVSEGCDGELIARTVYAANEDDARQAHRANYDEPVVAVHQ
jgi:hypothetical protein